MAYYCKTNTTSIQPTVATIYDTFTDSWTAIKVGVRAVRNLTLYADACFYNCYYTATEPLRATMYYKPFSLTLVLWNILFNLGFLYTAGRYILFFFYRDPSKPFTKSWSFLGEQIGDFIFRFIFSKFVHTDTYTF